MLLAVLVPHIVGVTVPETLAVPHAEPDAEPDRLGVPLDVAVGLERKDLVGVTEPDAVDVLVPLAVPLPLIVDRAVIEDDSVAVAERL